MSIFKQKTSKKAALVATAIGTAVVGTGVTLLYTTKKGKAIRKGASEKVNTLSSGVTSLLDSAEKKLKKVGKEVKRTEKKADSVMKKTKRLNGKIKRKLA